MVTGPVRVICSMLRRRASRSSQSAISHTHIRCSSPCVYPVASHACRLTSIIRPSSSTTYSESAARSTSRRKRSSLSRSADSACLRSLMSLTQATIRPAPSISTADAEISAAMVAFAFVTQVSASVHPLPSFRMRLTKASNSGISSG